MSDSDDEPITLSAHTLAALADFNADKDAHASKFERLKALAEDDADDDQDAPPLTMDAFTEDWNESQFWYSEETAGVLAKELLDGTDPNMTIAVLSTPSCFVALKNVLRKRPRSERPKLVLLEHDERFGVFPEFVFYDFQQPLKLPSELKGTMDRLIYDPPFLSDDCQTKIAMTARWLLKPATTSPSPRIVVCTGERTQALVTRLLAPIGVKTTTFEPHHPSGLSNEFLTYANFECASWKWRL